jgi:hypothetical protein
VREFAESHPSPVEPVPAALSELQQAGSDKAGRRPPTRLEVLIDSAIDALHARRAEHGPRSKAGNERPAPPFVPADLAYATASLTPRVETPRMSAPGLDLSALAQLCTRLGCALDAHEVTAVLEDASTVLDAIGVILWIPDAMGLALTPVCAYGYPEELVAQLPRVSPDANNASAEAFRTRRTCVVEGNDLETGAVVAPLLTPVGCAGVLAFEMRSGAEQGDDVRAAVTILAAQIAMLVGDSVLAHAHTLSA